MPVAFSPLQKSQGPTWITNVNKWNLTVKHSLGCSHQERHKKSIRIPSNWREWSRRNRFRAIFAPGVDSYVVLLKCHAILSSSWTDILCSNSEQWVMSTCLRSGVQRQASDDGELSWVNGAVLGVSVIRVNQQLHHLQMTLLTRRSQHPVQQILTHTRTYRKRQSFQKWSKSLYTTDLLFFGITCTDESCEMNMHRT